MFLISSRCKTVDSISSFGMVCGVAWKGHRGLIGTDTYLTQCDTGQGQPACQIATLSI